MMVITQIIMKLIVFALILQHVSSLGIRKCPKQEPIKDFNIDKFSGRWYEIERSFYVWELHTKCLSVDLQLKRPGIINISVNRLNRLSGSKKLTGGLGIQAKKNPSIFQVKVASSLPKPVDQFLPGAATYQVLYTDYETFAVIYSCSSYVLFHYDRIWILGRNWDINAETRLNIYRFLTFRNIDNDRLIVTNKDCKK
ncbi:apolipoprotein D-like [Onthophagus taurus]|uniref:apolipoprotein D-like n=1 Tax=Onthophagus taurus TaxID=166361 RepID=UPI0039BEC4A9